jgi:D-alanyl-D-alanine carboxypeptidase
LALYREFPREYRYFSVTSFEFRGATIPSHDHLLEWYAGADGIKTGYTVASGFNLATSAVRSGHRLVGVIMGGEAARVRDEEMAKLLDLGFDDVARTPATAPQLPPVQVAAASPPPPRPEPPPQPRPEPPRQLASAAPVEEPPAAERPHTLGAVARSVIKHLAPVASAEAAESAASEETGWSIEIGSFRSENTAEGAARKVARLAVAHGKPEQILPPSRAERAKLYRARLVHFSPQQAQAACGVLRKKGMPCAVVRSVGLHVASR